MKALTYIDQVKFALFDKPYLISRAYNRNKARDWKRDYHEPTSGVLFASAS